MDVQESNRKVPAHCWGRSIHDWTHWRWWMAWFYVCLLQPLLGGTAQCQQMVSSWFLPWGEARVCDWAPDFPGFTEKARFFLTSSKIFSHNYTTWGSTAVLEEQQPRLGREHIKGAWMLLTALGTPLGNPPMSHWNRLLYQFSSWLMGTAKLHTPHSNMSLPCDCLPEQPWSQECKCESLQIASEHMAKVNQVMQDWKSLHTSIHHLRENKYSREHQQTDHTEEDTV